MHAEDEDPRRWVAGDDAADRLQAAHPGHREIHHGDVGSALAEAAISLVAVGYLGYDANAGRLLEQAPESGAHDSVVVR